MRIEVIGEKAFVYAPFNTEFVREIKSIGSAIWDDEERAWKIPAASVETAREIMLEVYGENDVQQAEKVDIYLEFLDTCKKLRGPVSVCGISVCRAFGRDSGAKPSKGVDHLGGDIDSGGSRQNWYTIVYAGAIFLLHNVPRPKAEEILDRCEARKIYKAKIVEKKDTVDRVALEAEKAQLVERLKEIDGLLSQGSVAQ